MEILLHSVVSLLRVTLASLITLPLSIGLGYYCRNSNCVDRVLKFFVPIPKMAFLPIIMLIFGIKETSKIIFLMFFNIFQLTDSIKNAFLTIDANVLFMFKKCNADKNFLFWQIQLPFILPTIISNIGSCFSQSFAALMLAEGFGTTFGLGYFMLDSFLKFMYKETIFAIFLTSFLGCIFPFLSMFAIKRFCPWAKRAT